LTIGGKDDCQSNCRFRCRDADGKDGEHDSGQCCGGRSIAPEGYEVEVGGVEHEFNSDEDKNCVAPGECAGQADGKEQCGQEQITLQGAHFVSSLRSIAITTAPMSAAVSSRPIISSGRTKRCISASPIFCTVTSGCGGNNWITAWLEPIAHASTAKTAAATTPPAIQCEEKTDASACPGLWVIMMAKTARIATDRKAHV